MDDLLYDNKKEADYKTIKSPMRFLFNVKFKYGYLVESKCWINKYKKIATYYDCYIKDTD